MTHESPLVNKSFAFAVRIVKLCQHLTTHHKEYVLSKQILRSGTSIGANIRESRFAESSNDFSHKLSISLKEANESLYWLELLHASGLISHEEFTGIHQECNELKKMLSSATLTLKNKRK